ncbi:hypothetical protein CVU75_00565 [Candidatus Dependentiae bacterium HGW-Dependentiae-1]|nr:MAG: hypothetical protein CVU75_00565 [Candidatus Dependentiae bacterium HGW-Dependentiae-1]
MAVQKIIKRHIFAFTGHPVCRLFFVVIILIVTNVRGVSRSKKYNIIFRYALWIARIVLFDCGLGRWYALGVKKSCHAVCKQYTLGRVLFFVTVGRDMNKKIYVVFLLLSGMPASLFAGLFDAIGVAVAAPFVIGAALVGADLGQERRDREAHYRRQEYERDQQRKSQALAQLDNEYEEVQNTIGETEQAIARLSRTYESLTVQIANAERGKQQWQAASQERTQHLASLRKQLGECTQEYERVMASLKGDHDGRMRDLEKEIGQRLADLQEKQNQEVCVWEDVLRKEDAAFDVLRNQKRDLSSCVAVHEEQITAQKQRLANIVIQEISSGCAQTGEVMGAIELLGRNKDVLHAAEHARNVSLMVALIVSNTFKPADLTAIGSDYQSISKCFFREARRELACVEEGALSDEARAAWLQKLEKLGQRNFLCCSC